LKIADRIVHGSERLRLISQLSNLDYLKDLQQKYAIQNDLNSSQSRLAEIELNRLTSENQRQRLKLQRKLEISKLETKLEIDRDKLNRTSRVVSRFEGTVAQILTANDEYVKEGSPIVLLSSPKDDAPGIDDFGQPFDSIVFVPAGEGKRIDKGNFVEIMPATVKREEHGYIHGKVISVSELPVTRLGMEAALQHRDLVDTFLKRYAPGVLLRVHIKLSEDPVRKGEHDRKVEAMTKQQAANPTGRIEMPDDEVNYYVWSSSSGSRQPLKTGTMCEAAIVVERPPLITLVVPWLRRSMGLD
jgi:HlyD family secretion protein